MLKNGAGKCFFPHAENAGKKDKKECRLSGEFNPPRNKRAKKVSEVDLVEEIRASLETPEEKNNQYSMDNERLPEESSLPEKEGGKEETKDVPPQAENDASKSKEEEYQRLVNVALFAATRWDTI